MSTLREATAEIRHLLLDSVPDAWAASEPYLRLRRRLSRTPRRFVPPGPEDRSRQGLWLERKFAFPGQRLVIDAFPGSGNSFVSNTLRQAVDLPPAAITSHFHRRAQIQRAVALGLPTLVIVRDPRGACRSLQSKQPQLPSCLILARWIHYHRTVERLGDRVHVVLFRRVVEDVEVLREVPLVAELLADRSLDVDETLTRRSPKRTSLALDRPWNRALLRRAEALYRRLDPGSEVSGDSTSDSTSLPGATR